MNRDHQDPTPSSTAPAPEAGITPPPHSPTADQLARLEEIQTLARSGQNPSRLQELRKACDAERLRQIEELLSVEREEALTRLRQARQVCHKIMQPFQEASHRADLTVPEMIFLAKLLQRHVRQLVRSLLAERELLERQFRPPQAEKKVRRRIPWY